MKTMAEVLAEHGIWGYNGSEVACQCNPRSWVSATGYAAHQAEKLSAAGFGLVTDAQNHTTEGAQHYMTWGAAETAVCGANMVGRRNSALDTNTGATTCRRCCEWLDAEAAAEYEQDLATDRQANRDHNL